MKLNLNTIFSLIVACFLTTNTMYAQTELLSVIVNNSKEFMQVSDNDITFSFSIIILDGFTSTKWLKSEAESNSSVIVFGVSNSADFKSGERSAYLKVNLDKPERTFIEVMNSIGCKNVIYQKKTYSLLEFENEIRIK